MQAHVTQAIKLHKYLHSKGPKPGDTDTFATYFAGVTYASPTTPTPKEIRDLYTMEVLWHGNPISTVKTFGTNHCILCNQEPLQLFKRMKTTPGTLINKKDELFGACRHKPKFHRFHTAATQSNSSTDEASIAEKSPTVMEV